ncbi:MAG: glycosyltransferase [Planctomycetes bacterium]|jgi:glycosyltransferase involved in cell wall biosynthesis|nr:glycosyltransferase [Planctomycetota bacterium]
MKVALIHDHLAQDGGAERVLKILAEMFPEAPIYTLLYEQKNADKYYKGRKIETSIIQRLPGGIKHYQWYLPLMPLAVEFFDLSGFDLVISDTSSFAKGVITKPETLHICYCHTATRYLWSDTHQYINELKYNKFFKKIIALFLTFLRSWDRLAADRVDCFIANSKTVRRRIEKYYRHDSTVIYPPVEVDKFKIAEKIGDYFAIGCRLAPYKRVDIVIEAFKNLGVNYKLKIFGDGVDRKRLEKIANGASNIEFLGWISEDEKARLLSECLAFINPQEEDFGITPVEAMACGRPVIAYNKGGATETVVSGVSGLLFDDQSAEGVEKIISSFNKNDFNSQKIREWSLNFSVTKFKDSIKNFIAEKLAQKENF